MIRGNHRQHPSNEFFSTEFPERKVGDNRRRKYPFNIMVVGQAYICPAWHEGSVYTNKDRSRVANAAIYYGLKYGIKFSSRRQADGSIRVERVA